MLLLPTASGFRWVPKAQFRAGTSVQVWTIRCGTSGRIRLHSACVWDVTLLVHVQRPAGSHMAPQGKTSMRTFKTETLDSLICRSGRCEANTNAHSAHMWSRVVKPGVKWWAQTQPFRTGSLWTHADTGYERLLKIKDTPHTQQLSLEIKCQRVHLCTSRKRRRMKQKKQLIVNQWGPKLICSQTM